MLFLALEVARCQSLNYLSICIYSLARPTKSKLDVDIFLSYGPGLMCGLRPWVGQFSHKIEICLVEKKIGGFQLQRLGWPTYLYATRDTKGIDKKLNLRKDNLKRKGEERRGRGA